MNWTPILIGLLMINTFMLGYTIGLEEEPDDEVSLRIVNKTRCIEAFVEKRSGLLYVIRKQMMQSEHIVSRFDFLESKNISETIRFIDEEQEVGHCLEESIFGYSLLKRKLK